MDRYVEQDLLKRIKTLVYDGDFSGAETLIGDLEVDRMKNPSSLCLVGEVYMNVGKLSEAESVFLRAYDKSPGNRRILSLLTNLYIEKKDYMEADNYYKEFISVATRDVQRYILRYKIDSGKGEKLEALIGTLEKLKDYEYIEEWAYELATLYDKAGEKDKCVRECDEVVLWFGHGEFVDKAVALRNKVLGIVPEQKPEPEINFGATDFLSEEEMEEIRKQSEIIEKTKEPQVVPVVMPAEANAMEKTETNMFGNMDATVMDMDIAEAVAKAEAANDDNQAVDEPTVMLPMEDEGLEEMEDISEEEILEDDISEEEIDDAIEEDIPDVFAEPSDSEETPFEEPAEDATEDIEEDDFDDFEDEIIDGPDSDDDILLQALSAGDDEELVDEELLDDEDLDDDLDEDQEEDDMEEPKEEAIPEEEIEEAIEISSGLIEVEPETPSHEPMDIDEDEEVILMDDEVAKAFESVANIESLQNQLAKNFNPVAEGKNTSKNYLIRGNDDAAKTYISVAIPKFLDKFGICDKRRVVRVTAADLNGKDFSMIFENLVNGCLLIKNAHKLDATSVQIICDYVYSGNQQTVVILDSESADGFWKDNWELAGAFTQEIRIKPYSALDLLGIAKSCIEENGYELSFEASVTINDHFTQMLKNDIEIDFEDIFDLVSQAIRQLDERNIKRLLNPSAVKGRFSSNMITLESEDFLNILEQ